MTDTDATVAHHPAQHVVLVGCGRVGAGLAAKLVERDSTVTVIDTSAAAFRRLGDLDVDRVVGVGYDRETLLQAGIERATAVGAVTNGDNTNIVVARTARERFRVGRVFARIYDPRRAAIYERLGVPTIASASITVELALRIVDVHAAPDVQWVDPSGRLALVERAVPASTVGRRYHELERLSELRVVSVRRLGAAILPTPDLVAQEGDIVYVMAQSEILDRLDEHLAGSPTSGPHR